MTPQEFDQIARISRLAVLSSLMSSIVADDLDATPDLTRVTLAATIVPEGVSYALEYQGPGGVVIGEVSL